MGEQRRVHPDRAARRCRRRCRCSSPPASAAPTPRARRCRSASRRARPTSPGRRPREGRRRLPAVGRRPRSPRWRRGPPSSAPSAASSRTSPPASPRPALAQPLGQRRHAQFAAALWPVRCSGRAVGERRAPTASSVHDPRPPSARSVPLVQDDAVGLGQRAGADAWRGRRTSRCSGTDRSVCSKTAPSSRSRRNPPVKRGPKRVR